MATQNHPAPGLAAPEAPTNAGGGAVLLSAYTIGSDAAGAGVLTLAQSESAGRAAFMTAAVLGLGAILGTLFVSRTQVPSAPTAPATDLI